MDLDELDELYLDEDTRTLRTEEDIRDETLQMRYVRIPSTRLNILLQWTDLQEYVDEEIQRRLYLINSKFYMQMIDGDLATVWINDLFMNNFLSVRLLVVVFNDLMLNMRLLTLLRLTFNPEIRDWFILLIRDYITLLAGKEIGNREYELSPQILFMDYVGLETILTNIKEFELAAELEVSLVENEGRE